MSLNKNISLKVGTIILSVWSALNFIVGLWAIVFILLGHHAPALLYLFKVNEIVALDPKVLATIDGVALLLNTVTISFCILFFLTIKKVFKESSRWAFYVLFISIGLIQCAGYAADSLMGNSNLLLNNVSSLVLIIGFSLSAYGIFRSE